MDHMDSDESADLRDVHATLSQMHQTLLEIKAILIQQHAEHMGTDADTVED
jgi:hypothetical protein